MSALSEQMPTLVIDRERYYQFIESGGLGPEDKIELLGGQLVKKVDDLLR